MTIPTHDRLTVRQQANFACEYYGLSEDDVSGELTIDHYRPQSKGGSDHLENLVYCCIWCNQRKLNYWPDDSSKLYLFNPRQDSAADHFLMLDDGNLSALTEIGALTIRRLQLNRPALIAYRLRQDHNHRQSGLLAHYRDLLSLQSTLIAQITNVVEKQQELLAEQQRLLDLLLRQRR